MADFQKEMVSMGGKLKLKKGSGVTKSKKKTTDKSVSASMIGSSNLQPAALEGKRKSATNAPDNDESSSSVHDQVIVVQEVEWKPPTKTKAELAFIRRQKELQADRVYRKAQMSHREKVEKFNGQMNELTEFNDVPKVSWTK